MDVAFLEPRVFLEIEGAVWTGGRHVNPSGYLKDIEKYNAAAVLGWRMIRCTPDDKFSDKVWAMIAAAINFNFNTFNKFQDGN